MTDHERLREQYEDALFALLMEGCGGIGRRRGPAAE